MSLPTLKAIADGERVWSGQASTTQLLKGTRQAYLEITQDYAVSPDEYAFALIGTRHHKILDAVAKKLDMISEKKLDGEVSGILDLLERDSNAPWYCPDCGYIHNK
jgi:rubrerythrin